MTPELHQQVLGALVDRQSWDEKQRQFYAIRNGGLRRAHKPFPGAADTSCQLSDGKIEKAKPFYFNQLFAGERIADFTGRNEQTAAVQDMAADLLDHILKEEIPYAREVMSAVDTMLVRQRGLLKHYWDPEKQAIVVEAVDPLFFVVPTRGVGPDEDDWFCHIRQVSVDWYRRQRVYDQSPEVIARIRGGDRDEVAASEADQEKFEREGLTYSPDKNTIVLFELWQKTPGGWTIFEYSPQAPAIMLRRPRGCATKWQSKPWQPFVGLEAEIKEKGWYAPRGIVERLAPFETVVNRLQNSKLDAMSFYNTPLFQRDADVGTNVVNFRFRPGEVLPRGVAPVQMPSPPIAFDQEIMSQRQQADDYIALPDAGTGANPLLGSSGKDKTARQVSYEAEVQGATTNMRGWVFRQGLAESLKRVWALQVQYRPQQLAWFAKGRRFVLPPEAISDQFSIQPAGPIDGWDKARRLQRAAQRFMALRGDPLINQEELYTDLLAAEDARLPQRLLLPQGMKAATEAEDEAQEIVLMMNGWPAVALPNEDHALRLKVLLAKVQALGQMGEPVDPNVLGLLRQHVQQHLMLLRQQDPKQAEGALAAIEEMTGAQPQANVTPMPATADPALPAAGPMPEQLTAAVGGMAGGMA